MGARFLTVRTSDELRSLDLDEVLRQYRGLIFQGKTLIDHLSAVSDTARNIRINSVNQGSEFAFTMAMSLSKVSTSNEMLEGIRKSGVVLVAGDAAKAQRIMQAGVARGKRLMVRLRKTAKGKTSRHVKIA